jgi:hypothetical protein
MTITRRTVLKSSVALSIATAVPAVALQKGQTIAVYDSRIPESRVFAKTPGSAVMIDIAGEEAHNWAGLRQTISGTRHIKGLTGWSDWVTARGFLEERGLRLVSETSVPAPLSGKAHLFAWEMRG